jgi:restriction system protein
MEGSLQRDRSGPGAALAIGKCETDLNSGAARRATDCRQAYLAEAAKGLGLARWTMGKRNSWLNDLVRLGMRLHWSTTTALAVLCYVALHYLANQGPLPATELSQIGGSIVLQLVRTCAGFLQYVVPAFLLLGAIVASLQRHRGRSLLSQAAASPQALIHSVGWQDFERLVGASFERSGFTVECTGGTGADGGVDLVLTKERERTLVQCKQWRAQRVGVATVRELYGVMAAQGAAAGIVVSAGEFTPDACEFAQGRNIELLTGQDLSRILAPTGSDKGVVAVAATPTCPKCGSSMVKRTARRGRAPGQSFWGCETYPRCRGTISV